MVVQLLQGCIQVGRGFEVHILQGQRTKRPNGNLNRVQQQFMYLGPKGQHEYIRIDKWIHSKAKVSFCKASKLLRFSIGAVADQTNYSCIYSKERRNCSFRLRPNSSGFAHL